MMNEEKTKSFAVSKAMVYNSYLKVCEKKGSAGIDKETIEMFSENLRGNLYKVWNRMSSGSYFPPAVRTVLIPKKQGGNRPLGIPPVGDRIAQGVVKDFLEPILEPLFHVNSFGYRPGRSAHDALAQCQRWADTGVDQLTFGIGPATREQTIETIRLLGEHVIPKIDTDPVHRTTKMRQAAVQSAGAAR